LKNVGSIRASNARGIPEERMKVELLSVGTELLLGEIVDTNAVYLAEKLSRLGINVFHKTTVGDNAERLAAALRTSMGRSDVVLATGGLGPTEDDITAAAVAHVAGVDLVEDEATAERIRSFARQRGIGLLDKLLKQAHVPRGATVVPNPTGTAPGVIVTRDGKTVITLPGVPSEMKAMAEETVLPYLARRVASAGPGTILSRVLRLTGIGESQVEAEIADLIRNQGNPTIAPLARTFEVHLRLTARASDAAQARSMLAPLEAEIRQRVGEHIYGAGHRLTNVPGSSDYLLAVLVTYGNESKMKLLDVPRDTLEQHGAASAEAAGAMAEGVRATCGAAVGLAVTGIAGPTGARPGKPVGLVYAAVANGADTTAERHVLRGDRLTVKGRASQAALHLLYRSLGAMKAGQACQCTS
jgi:nicotinamide-nucleotide amidase